MARGAVALGGLALAGVALPLLVLEEGGGPAKPAKVERSLELTEARISEMPKGLCLLVEGRTDLPDGCALHVAVLADSREVATFAGTTARGRFALEQVAAGQVVEGSYSVRVTFLLEAQSEALRKALGYQPARLEARRPLLLPPRLVAASEATGELRQLFEALNQGPPRDKAALDDIDRRAIEMSRRLWIAEQKAALHKLRLAVEEARRPELRRRDFERLLLEAHVLAGL